MMANLKKGGKLKLNIKYMINEIIVYFHVYRAKSFQIYHMLCYIISFAAINWLCGGAWVCLTFYKFGLI